MKIFEKYIFRNLGIATIFVACILTLIVFLTQSLRFLELILDSGTSSSTLWVITLLALPRFFEIILPLSIMCASLFIYNKMTSDSELIAIRAVGHSPFSLAKPAFALGAITTLTLWVVTLWIAPASLAKMQKMRLEITTEFSTMLFREGVFNQVGKGLTVYIHKREKNGQLSGLMLYDSRDKNKSPTTILAKRGAILSTKEGQQVVVYDSWQQQFDLKSGILQRLHTDRYTIDLPDSEPVKSHWAEPDERTINQLLNPDLKNNKDRENLNAFFIEIHRRITSPLLALAFPLIAVTFLLIGPIDRRGQTLRVILAVCIVMLLQSLFLASYNLTRASSAGLICMYFLTIGPIAICLFLLSGNYEGFCQKAFFGKKKALS